MSRQVMLAATLGLMVIAACARDRSEGSPDSAAKAAPAPPLRVPRDTIFVEIDEWSLAMSRDSIPAGPVIFRVFNISKMRHEFEVENGDEEVEAGEIAPGAFVDMRADLGRGTYNVECPMAGPEGSHAKLGMRAVLKVT